MNKRIISFLLVAIMIVAMIPAVLINSSAADVATYVTTVTSEKIELDGVLDEPYKNSQQITSTSWGTGNSSGLSFVAYTAVTIRGIYVWAEIKDTSLNKDTSHPAGMGDKFQIYVRMNNGVQDAWGYYDTDYNGKTAKTSKGGSLADCENVTVKLSDGSGWRSETFIPFDGVLDPAVAAINTYKLYIGLQANNAIYKPSSNENDYTAYCFDNSNGSSFWSKNDNYTLLKLFTEDDIVTKTSLEKTAVYVKTSSNLKLDGSKDAAYSDRAKMDLAYVTKDSNYTASETRENLGTVYIAFTNYNLFIYYETEDVDIVEQDFFQVYYEFDNGAKPISGYFCAKIDPDGNHFYGSNGQAWGYPGVAIENSNIKVTTAAKALGNNKYGLEFQIPLTSAIRTAMKDGSAKIKLDFSANDYASDGSRKFYGGCTSYSSAMYNYNVYGDQFPGVVLSKSFTDETPGVITGASVALGSDITVNYYAAVSAGDIFNTCMRFTKNGETYIAYPERAGYTGEYKFAYKGVAPQTIGDNIKAELVVDGTIVATHDNYSVLQNLLNIYNNEAYSSSSYNNMKMLIKGLLNYGAAAQKYANYKTDALVNEGHELTLTAPAASVSVRDTGTAISSNLKIDAAGVYFDSYNRIYAKITATSLKGVTVTINGQLATIEKVEGEANRYIVYSDPISVTKFNSIYRIVLSNGSASQVVTYSVNSYAYAKSSSENPKTAELAKATYTYGELARKYANLGTASYTVMSYNDGDTSYANQKNYEKVAVIINDYAPDIVGMQEVQQKHAKGSSSYYAQLLPDYGIVYYDHGTYNNNATLADKLANNSNAIAYSEKQNPSGVPIFYRKDRFTLISSGQGWLSDTPDKASKYTESDYTRSYVWAKLQDKRTGEIIVAVNTHIDYVPEANIKQVNKLLELVAEKFPGENIIMTADWNMGKGYASYQALNNAGYYAAEELLEGAFTPPTTPGGGYIDFCFVSSDKFTTFDYKVVNNHQYSETASDHYAIIAEVALVKIAPEASLGETIEGPFHTPDDTDGF